MTPSILLLDQDPDFSKAVTTYLQGEGYDVTVAHDGETGLKQALYQTFQLIIMDVTLPKKNGLSVLQALRDQHITTPVIMLSSHLDEVNTLLSYDFGAASYLTKPCDPHVLLAQIRSTLRRQPAPSVKNIISIKSITLDTKTHIAYQHDAPLDLTNAEFNILEILMTSPQQAFSKKELTEYALSRDYTAYDRSIDMHISNLRQKLGQNDNNEPWIKTVRGFGYAFNS